MQSEVELKHVHENYAVMLRDRSLCDVVVQAMYGDAHIHAHKIILAAHSTYFHALFVGAGQSMRQFCAAPRGNDLSSPQVALVDNVEQDVLMLLLESIYAGKLRVDRSNVQQLLKSSDYLGISSVSDACCEFLEQSLSAQTALSSLKLAYDLQLQPLLYHAMAFSCSHFSKLVAEEDSSAEICRLPLNLFEDLLAAEQLQAISEIEVAQVVVWWLESHRDERPTAVPLLLSKIRLQPRQLLAEVEAGEVHVAAAYREELLRSLGESCTAAQHLPPPLPRHKLPEVLVAAGGHDAAWHSLRSTEVYHPDRDIWEDGPSLPQGFSFAAGAAFAGGEDGHVIGGATHGTAVARLSDGSWRRAPLPCTGRLNAAVATSMHQLWLLGGRAGATAEQSGTEWLDRGGDTWYAGPSMLHARTALAAACLQDQLYAIGGQAGKHVHATVEQYDSGGGSGRFVEHAAQMHQQRKYHSCCALQGRIVVLGGMDATRTRLRSAEALDPREGRWHQLPPMAHARASSGVSCIGDRLYVVAGSGHNDSIERDVACWCPTAGKWKECHPLKEARSNLALLALSNC